MFLHTSAKDLYWNLALPSLVNILPGKNKEYFSITMPTRFLTKRAPHLGSSFYRHAPEGDESKCRPFLMFFLCREAASGNWLLGTTWRLCNDKHQNSELQAMFCCYNSFQVFAWESKIEGITNGSRGNEERKRAAISEEENSEAWQATWGAVRLESSVIFWWKGKGPHNKTRE